MKQLSCLLDPTLDSILRKEFVLSNTLIIRCADVVSKIPVELVSADKSIQERLENCANLLLDTVYMQNEIPINTGQYRAYIEAEQKILIRYPKLFIRKFESFIEEQLETILTIDDVSVEGKYI